MLGAVGLAYGQSRATEGPIRELVRLTENRTPGDSVIYANAAYHAAHASESYRKRWGPTGYMTLGTGFVLLGAALVLSAMLPRSGEATSRSASP